MTTEQIEEIKKNGSRRELIERVGIALWRARKNIEEAPRDNYEDFVSKISEARVALDEAETLWGASAQL